jgi:uroporphyrin-III C-methyltransferase/precorrin-2 dehydrogenase/sirohydrochlorin ferrochelatase
VALSGLPLFHRVAGQRVVVIGEGDAADAKRRLVERAGGVCCGEPEAHHARLAFVAIGDAGKDEATAMRLKSKGLLVNVADRPELCDFTLPSVLERGPVMIAVGTGGASAGLAKQLRLRFEALLPQSLGKLADGLFAARPRLRERYPDPSERRRAIDAALTRDGPLDPLDENSAGRVEEWLTGSGRPESSRTVEILLTSADPDDLTLRQSRLLGEADTILYDPEVPEAILARARADSMRYELQEAAASAAGVTVVLRCSPASTDAPPSAT